MSPLIGALKSLMTRTTTHVPTSTLARALFGGATPLTRRVTARTVIRMVVFTAASLAALLLHSTAHATDDSESLPSIMTRLRVQEAPQPIRENPQWRAPRKVVLLAFGNDRGWEGREAAFAAAAPKTQVIVAKDMAAAVAATADADVLVGFNPEICAARLVDNDKQLRWLASLAAGVENCMAVPGVRSRNLLLTNMRGVDSAVIAEHAVALAMALAHSLDTFAVDTSKGQWSNQHGNSAPIETLAGKTMLVVGLGGIGTEVALRAHGLGMQVVATRDNVSNKPDFVSHVGTPEEMLTLAKSADVIVNAVPLTPQTKGMYDARFFAVLKPGAYFVNVARGASVVTADLVSALNEHRLAGAGLDVVDPEPLPADSPLWHAPHVIITPHISSRSDFPSEARWTLAVENLRRYANGEKMLSVVDLTKGY
jgi:phosphoglycerate dehydrogenase-like enzyme